LSIRLRLAAWYTGVLALSLFVFGLLLYFHTQDHLMDMGNESIVSRANHLAASIESEPPASLDYGTLEIPSIDAFQSAGIYVQVFDGDGRVLARSSNLGDYTLPASEQALTRARDGQGVFYWATVGRERVRVFIRRVVSGSEHVAFVAVATDYDDAYHLLPTLRLVLLGGGLFSLVLAGTIGWAIAARALKPVAAVTAAAREIALSKDFSRRVENTNKRDELGQLSSTFNHMLESLEESCAAQHRFVADASHELRAPLTAVRANLELLSQQGDDLPAEERKALVRDAAGEADRMARMVGDLLSLARADAGQKPCFQPLELDRLLLDVYGEAKTLAKGVKVTVKDIDQVSLSGDRDLLKQLLLILIDNAIRYTPASGEVSLSLRKDRTHATLEVADTGVGIAPEDLPHIFERFYRADKARERNAGGSGLGLAIGRWIVEQHGGDIDVKSVVGQGSTFTVRLPLDNPTPPGQLGPSPACR